MPRSGLSSRKLVQPLVRQYSRVDIERRRMRRIEAERPLMDDWYERESMWFLGFLLPRSGRYEPWSAVDWLVAGGAIERWCSACWTRERGGPDWGLERRSDTLALLGHHRALLR